jgi:hypothetical protein
MTPAEITTDPIALAEIERRCVDAWQGGAKRVSVRKVMESVRADLRLSVNNNDQTAITDRLRAAHPGIPIEVRDRGNRGKNKPKTGRTIETALATLKAASRVLGVEVDAITWRQVKTGKVRTDWYGGARST